MFYLHDKAGCSLHFQTRNLQVAISEAKKHNFAVSVSELRTYPKGQTGVFGAKQYFELVYSHVPNPADIKGWKLQTSLLTANMKPNELRTIQ